MQNMLSVEGRRAFEVGSSNADYLKQWAMIQMKKIWRTNIHAVNFFVEIAFYGFIFSMQSSLFVLIYVYLKLSFPNISLTLVK